LKRSKQRKIFPLILLLLLSFYTDAEGEDSMGFVRNLFGKQPEISVTSEMMEEDLFWSIIEKSLRNSHGQDEQEAFLIKDLQSLSPTEIIGFRLRTDKLLYDTYNSEMWCAAYIMNGGCSDDCFEYFRLWVISKGKEVYQNAKENPDTLISQVSEGQDYYEFETFWYVSLAAFEKKTGKELYDYIDCDNHKFSEGSYPDFEFNWEEDNPETMEAICPQLYKMLWE
jgi:hypothetical protein